MVAKMEFRRPRLSRNSAQVGARTPQAFRLRIEGIAFDWPRVVSEARSTASQNEVPGLPVKARKKLQLVA